MPRSHTLALVLLIGCSSRSPAPAAPAVAPVIAPDAGLDAPSAPPGVDPRLATAMAAFERMIRALEAAGDCDAAAANLRAFADTDDGRAMAKMKDDPELGALAEQQRAAIEAAYPSLGPRLNTVMAGCQQSEAMHQAIAESPLFTTQAK